MRLTAHHLVMCARVQSQAAAVERLVVLDFKRTVAALRPDVRDKLKESLYRISRATNSKGGLMKTIGGPGRAGGRSANMDGFVVQLLYNSWRARMLH